MHISSSIVVFLGIVLVLAPSQTALTQKDAPHAYYCPITMALMEDPVVTKDGYSYERSAITSWLKTHNTSPLTNLVLADKSLVPNLALRRAIQDFVKVQRRQGQGKRIELPEF